MDTLEESSYFKMIVKDAISDLKHKGNTFFKLTLNKEEK